MNARENLPGVITSTKMLGTLIDHTTRTAAPRRRGRRQSSGWLPTLIFCATCLIYFFMRSV